MVCYICINHLYVYYTLSKVDSSTLHGSYEHFVPVSCSVYRVKYVAFISLVRLFIFQENLFIYILILEEYLIWMLTISLRVRKKFKRPRVFGLQMVF